MTRADDRFVPNAEGIVSAELVSSGEFIRTYHGQLSDADEPARILAVSPDRASSATTEAFSQAAIGWHSTSTHSNIVSVYDRGQTPQPWIAVEQQPEKTLATIQPELRSDTLRTVIWETAEAIRNAALYNTTHLSLRPNSIWIHQQAGDERTVVVDEWGIKHAVQTASKQLEVTPYTAPELFTDPDAGGTHTDVYGLGAIAYYAITGEPPVTEDNLQTAIREGKIRGLSQHSDQISSRVESVLFKALATDPSDRYDTAHAFKQAFDQTFTSTE